MPKFNGYAEGFYGKLLGWSSRFRLLTLLKSCGFNSYLYAPKEDLFHRRDWRMAYSNDWCRKFTEFTKAANNCGVSVFAGIAPGLDFDFSSLDKSYELSGDLSVLVEKAKVLRSCGAAKIVILMDDIDSDFDTRRGQFSSEGKAHAKLVNLVGEAINEPIIIVPRIYSDSLIHVDDEQSQFYLRDLMTDLNEQHFVVYCGDDIVAKRCGVDSKGYIPERRAIVWDNFYANDYSPRRLYRSMAQTGKRG